MEFNRKKLEEISQMLNASKGTVSTAESCTGGLIAAALTELPGSSSFFCGGVVTYTLDAKKSLLGLPADLFLSPQEAVTAEVASAMAISVKKKFSSTYSISTTGIAGPTGGRAECPIGTIFISICSPNSTKTKHFSFHGSRSQIRLAATETALELLISSLV